MRMCRHCVDEVVSAMNTWHIRFKSLRMISFMLDIFRCSSYVVNAQAPSVSRKSHIHLVFKYEANRSGVQCSVVKLW
jgi:hypothetical protein